MVVVVVHGDEWTNDAVEPSGAAAAIALVMAAPPQAADAQGVHAGFALARVRGARALALHEPVAHRTHRLL